MLSWKKYKFEEQQKSLAAEHHSTHSTQLFKEARLTPFLKNSDKKLFQFKKILAWQVKILYRNS
jgi:hypothetical protein